MPTVDQLERFGIRSQNVHDSLQPLAASAAPSSTHLRGTSVCHRCCESYLRRLIEQNGAFLSASCVCVLEVLWATRSVSESASTV